MIVCEKKFEIVLCICMIIIGKLDFVNFCYELTMFWVYWKLKREIYFCCFYCYLNKTFQLFQA